MKYLNLKKIIAGLFVCLIITGGLFAQGSKNKDFPNERTEREFSKGERPMREDFVPEAKRPRPPRPRPVDEDMENELNPNGSSEEETPERPKMRKAKKNPQLEGFHPDDDNTRPKMFPKDKKFGDKPFAPDDGKEQQGKRRGKKMRPRDKMNLTDGEIESRRNKEDFKNHRFQQENPIIEK